MNYILFDDFRGNLLPLTYTRPVSEIRIGILTITKKWEHFFNTKFSFYTEDYLQQKFSLITEEDNLWVNGSICPDTNLVSAIKSLSNNQCLKQNDTLIAYRSKKSIPSNVILYEDNFMQISQLWHIFEYNDDCIKSDFKLITEGRISELISETNACTNPENIFLEEGAKVEHAILNASTGPIYVGKNAQIMEGCIVRGPLAMCENSVLKMGAKIYGATTLGPYCKVGGEVNNSVFMGYSNKSHDGFLGNSVIGEWCNLGADTNNSNLKNNYAEVKLWNYPSERFINTGLQFCGLVMADHSKCGINTMFNTGSVVGVSANIYGTGFPRNFVSSFLWGGSSGYVTYRLNKVFEVAEKVMQRRAVDFNQVEKDILAKVFELTKSYRKD
ncbi:MAG: glucose-1-phosphate thymidylyltransferase [Flavobacteriales bacterium]|nr:glucose-1-phosphate thymidylyltransferase [Flavobacteriales bacterium]|tara:strand:+ start:99 stop:1253 length:1155 start_codon:yes stop_codon:yes gene_type:complete